jgi:hypothetical protein
VHFWIQPNQPASNLPSYKSAHQAGKLAIRADGVGVVAKIAHDLQKALLPGRRTDPGGTAPAQ